MVVRLAREIDDTYVGQDIVVVGVLKGSFVFLADLIRQMKSPISGVEFVRASSYGSATTSSGTPELSLGIPDGALLGKHVLLVEDIVDTGFTTSAVLQHLKMQRAASVHLCALLDKPDRRRVVVTPDFVGIEIPDVFVVGYGLDFGERYRELPSIYTLEK